MKINKETIKRILVVRNDRFGEFLLNIPALRALKETFPSASITLVAKPGVKELVEDSIYIDEIIIDDFSDKLNFWMLLRLVSQLGKQNFQMAVMLNPCKIFNLITFFAGIPIRVGYKRKWPFFLNKKIKDKKFEAKKHEVEYNLELVSLVGAKTNDLQITLPLRKNDLIKVDEFLVNQILNSDKLIAIHPWTSDEKKHWPLSNFITLINLLTALPNLKIALIGGKENLDLISDDHFNIKASVVDLVGKLTLRQSSCLLAKCKCLISADSGPVHLAAASGIPAIVLFRSQPPAVSAKRWGPWGKGHVIIQKENVQDITPGEVFDKIKELL